MSKTHHITTTLNCNNHCVFCAQRADHPPTLPPSPQGQADRVVFAGGEPTLDDELHLQVAKARAEGVLQVLIQTNGRRLAYGAYLTPLVEAGVTHFDISLHGPLPPIHDYHTQVQGSFLQTLRGIRNALTTGAQVGITTVVTRSNCRHLPALASLLVKLGVKHWHLSIAQPMGAAVGDVDAITPRLALVEEALPETLSRAARGGLQVATSGLPACITSSKRADRILLPEERRPLPPVCEGCLYAARCSGPTAGTPTRYAEYDLHPLSDPAVVAGIVEWDGDEPWFGGIGLVATPDGQGG